MDTDKIMKNLNEGINNGVAKALANSKLNDLLCCPCGATPKALCIVDNGQGGKWASASGNCCDEWSVEFRTQYYALDSDECKALAHEAWNEAPRAT